MSIKKIHISDTLVDSILKKKATKKPRQKNINRTLRKEFLKKIKERQDNSITPTTLTVGKDDFESEFDKSLSFLNSLILENTKPITIEDTKPITIEETNPLQISVLPKTDIILPKYVATPTPYTSLKHTGRPTYRQMKRTQPLPEAPSNATVPSIVRIKRTTKTLKRTLGKKDKSVSVLIKNMTIKHKIQEETQKLKHTNIHDIKMYLIQRNLLKSGSQCPPDVLRKMYEQCILSGDINNNNLNTKMHNYLNQN
jgi:hypothetical protein